MENSNITQFVIMILQIVLNEDLMSCFWVKTNTDDLIDYFV